MAPTLLIASAVAKKLNELVITSSPGPIPRPLRASTRASVPLLQPMAWGLPQAAANCCSKAAIRAPDVLAATQHLQNGVFEAFTQLMKLLGEIEGGHLHGGNLNPLNRQFQGVPAQGAT